MPEEDLLGRGIVVVGKEYLTSEALVCTYVAAYGHNCVYFHLQIGQVVSLICSECSFFNFVKERFEAA